MSATYAAPGAIAGPRLATEKLRGVLLWLTGLSGAFVFIEPSPYELVGLATMLVFMLTGLPLRTALAPFILLLLLLNVGYALAVIQVIDESHSVTWVAVSAFLAGTAIFYAAMLGTNTEARLRWLLRGYLAAALIASVLAVAGYFRLFGGISDMFLLYGRARGTFNDPNVLGAFLVLPGLLIFQRLLTGRLAAVLGNSLLLFVVLAALLLSFSRGAWGQFAFAALILLGLTFMTSRSLTERSRIVVIAVLGALLMAVFIAALLSISQVADLFKERATLDQSYDLGHYGRFGRYSLGADLALDHPFGIGPLGFAKIFFPEDPHNTVLNSFMSGGWLGGFAFIALTLVTLLKGLRFVFVATPWRPTYLAVYAAYVGVIAEGMIIDIDHWRHYFLILGVLWGLMAASQAYLCGAADRADAGLVPAHG
jgi:O-antigen ligase